MNSLHREFGASADFAMLYIAEAHAQDEWPISSSRCNAQRGPVRLRTHRLVRGVTSACLLGIADGMFIARVWTCRYSS